MAELDLPDGLQGLQRDDLFGASLSQAYLKDARRVQMDFEQFLDRLGIPSGPEGVTIWLTHLAHAEGLSGQQIRSRLARLDLMQRIKGQPRWQLHEDIRLFLTGLHREKPLGPTRPRSEPLYPEHVRALVDSVMQLRPRQVTDRAAVLLVHQLGLLGADLGRLRWSDVRFRSGGVTIGPLVRPHAKGPIRLGPWRVDAVGGELCLRQALKRLRAETGPGVAPFARSGNTRVDPRTWSAVRLLRTPETDVRQIIDQLATEPLQARNRALLLIGFGAAMGAEETMSLRQRDISITGQGLLVTVPRRRQPTGIPCEPDSPYDPVTAWQKLLNALDQQGVRADHLPAFPAMNRQVFQRHTVDNQGLNWTVKESAKRARLEGYYTWTSLRSGWIRAAFRDEQMRPLTIAQHIDLRSIDSLGRHERREHVLRRSVAGQLGL